MKLKYLFSPLWLRWVLQLAVTSWMLTLYRSMIVKGFSAKRQRLTAPLTGYMQS